MFKKNLFSRHLYNVQLKWSGFVAALFVMFMATGCNLLRGSEGPGGPLLSGSLNGTAVLVNANGSQQNNDDHILVTLDGIGLHTYTDSSGDWSFDNLQTGTYSITYTKTKYSMTRLSQVQFVGGGDRYIGKSFLCQPPAWKVTNLSAELKAGIQQQSIRISISDTTQGYYRCLVFLGDDKLVSFHPNHYQHMFSAEAAFLKGTNTSDIKLTTDMLITAGFAYGDSVYAVAFPANSGSNNSEYLDTATQNIVYTNIDTVGSNVIVFETP